MWLKNKRYYVINIYDIEFKLFYRTRYVAAPRKMCRKISKLDYVPNPWQVTQVGERVGGWQWRREGGWFYKNKNFLHANKNAQTAFLQSPKLLQICITAG